MNRPREPDDALVFSLHQCGALLETALSLSEVEVEAGLADTHSFVNLCRTLSTIYQPSSHEQSTELSEMLEVAAAQFTSLLQLGASRPSRVPAPDAVKAAKSTARLLKLVAAEQQYRTRDELYRWKNFGKLPPPAQLSSDFYQKVLPVLQKSVPDPLLYYWPRGDRALEGAAAPVREMGLVDHGAQRDLLRKRFVVPRRFTTFVRPHRHLHLSGPKGCGKKFLATALHVLLFVSDENRPFDNLEKMPPVYEVDARDLQGAPNPAALLVELYTYLQHVGGRVRVEDGAAECQLRPPRAPTPGPEFYAHATVLVTHVHEVSCEKLPLPHPEEHPDVLAIFTSDSGAEYVAETDVSIQLGLPTFAVRRSVVLHSLYQALQFETTLPPDTPAASRAAVAAGFFTNAELVRAAERVAYATGADWREVQADTDEAAWNLFLLQQATGLPADVVAHAYWQKPVQARKKLLLLQRSAGAPTGTAAPSEGLETSSVEEVLGRLQFDASAAVNPEEERGADELRRSLLEDTIGLEPLALQLATAHQYVGDLNDKFEFKRRLDKLATKKTTTMTYPANYLNAALDAGYTLRNEMGAIYSTISTASKISTVEKLVAKIQKDLSCLAKFHDERHLLRFFDQLEGKPEPSSEPEPLQFDYDLSDQDAHALVAEMSTVFPDKVGEGKEDGCDAKLWDQFKTKFKEKFDGKPVVKKMDTSTFEELRKEMVKNKLNFGCKEPAVLQHAGVVAQLLVAELLVSSILELKDDGSSSSKYPLLTKYFMRFRNALDKDGDKVVHVVCGGVNFDRAADLVNVGVPPAAWRAALRATVSEPCTVREFDGGNLLYYENALLRARPLLGVFHRADALTTLPVFVGGPNRSNLTVQFLGTNAPAAALKTLHEQCQAVREDKFQKLSTDLKKKLKLPHFCQELQGRLRWGFLAEYGGRAHSGSEDKTSDSVSLRQQWHKQLQQNVNVNWSELQGVFDRHRGALVDLNSSGPVNVVMFVLEQVYLNSRDAQQPRVTECRWAFLRYALNPSAAALQTFKDTLRTQAERAVRDELQVESGNITREFWETCVACAAACHVQRQLEELSKTSSNLEPQKIKPSYFVDLCVGFVPGSWRDQLLQEKVYTRPLSRRKFRLLYLGHALVSTALQGAKKNDTKSSEQKAVAARLQFDATTERLRARQVAESPFGWTCAALADAVRRGVENFLFCKLQLEFDPNEQCHFYCFQDANVHRASCAHGAVPVRCKECRPSAAGVRSFLRNLNALLFETDDQLLVFQQQPLNVNARAANEKILQAAETATALFAVLQDVGRRDPQNLVFSSLQKEFERAVLDAGKLVLPYHQQYKFHDAVLLKKRKVVQSARRFLVENLLDAVTDALADTSPHPFSRAQGEQYVRSALRYYSLQQTPG